MSKSEVVLGPNFDENKNMLDFQIVVFIVCGIAVGIATTIAFKLIRREFNFRRVQKENYSTEKPEM